MFYIILEILATLVIVASVPIDNSNTKYDASLDELVYVPYNIQYKPKEHLTVSEDDQNKEIKDLTIDTKNKNAKEKVGDSSAENDDSGEKYALVPISFLINLKKNKNLDVSRITHTVVKRQTSNNGFIVQRRRIARLPAFVGYLNNYDNFPTVAV